MLKALILDRTRTMEPEIAAALASMNFDLEIIRDADAGNQLLREEGELIHLVAINVDAHADDAGELIKLQKQLGYMRPVIGLSAGDNPDQHPLLQSDDTARHPDRILQSGTRQEDLRRAIAEIFNQYGNHEKRNDKPRVLIVEDDDEIRCLLSRRLLKNGMEPFAAVNGLHGREQISTLRPDLILMDMNMDGMDGFTLTRLLKEDEQTQSIPIIAVTGEEKEKCISNGVDDYCPKPVEFKILLATIKRYLPEQAA